MNKVYVYIYEKKYLLNDIILPNRIEDHCNKYKNLYKRNISKSNYYYLCDKLRELGYHPDRISFNDNNKPISNECYFSLSHSKEYFGFAISNIKIGFDLEKIIKKDKIKIGDKILNSKELIEIKDYDNKEHFITEKWCIKEAYGKYLGCGITANVLKDNIEGVIYTSQIYDTILAIYTNEEYELVMYINNIKK
ncbi:MAG: 4'-phosphopantetheinyl transferase family protein [Anaeroplasma sp.]